MLQISGSFAHLGLKLLMTFQKASFGAHSRPIQMIDNARSKKEDAQMNKLVAAEHANRFWRNEVAIQGK